MKYSIILALSLFLSITVSSAQTKVKFKDKLIKLKSKDIITLSASTAEDEETLVEIMNSLEETESPKPLKIDYDNSIDVVENGLFIFYINTRKPKILSLELFDAEGFDMGGNSKIKIKAGGQYKGIDLSKLETGSYHIKIKDKVNKEAFIELITIAN